MARHRAPEPETHTEPYSPALAFYALAVLSLIAVMLVGLVRIAVGV